jgi:Tol biopolymer transport system component
MNRWIPTFAALAVALVLAVPAVRHWRERPPAPVPPAQPLRSSWIAPGGLVAGAGADYLFGLSLAPDGRRVVYPAAKAGVVALWLHDLRNGESRALPGTDSAVAPFWSADGSKVGFFANGHVRALDLGSGTASDLADAPAGRGATWNAAGDLVFAPAPNGALMRRDPGGAVSPLTTLDGAQGEASHSWPSFLPDGRHVIFLVTSSQSSRAGIWIASLDDPSTRRRLLASDSQAVVADHGLLYLSDLVLMWQPLDRTTFDPAGAPAVVALQTGRGPLAQLFATASSDVLIYGAPGTTLRELRWVARDGQPAGSTSEPIDAWDLRLAPDGKRMVVTEIDRQLRTLDVFIRTGSQPAPTRLSLSTDVDESGVWSPDGLRIAWAGQRRKVMIRGAGAVLPEQTIATFDTPVQVWDWSRDGRSLLISRRHADTGDDLWIQPPTERADAQPYAVMAFDQVYGAWSPDGRSIAYASNESGQFDIYVDTFPKPGARVRVTTAGGTEPRWSADGSELFFRRGSEIHAVRFASNRQVESITKLFDASAPIRAYDVGRDGRFLINLPAAGHQASAATLVHHWKP